MDKGILFARITLVLLAILVVCASFRIDALSSRVEKLEVKAGLTQEALAFTDN